MLIYAFHLIRTLNPCIQKTNYWVRIITLPGILFDKKKDVVDDLCIKLTPMALNLANSCDVVKAILSEKMISHLLRQLTQKKCLLHRTTQLMVNLFLCSYWNPFTIIIIWLFSTRLNVELFFQLTKKKGPPHLWPKSIRFVGGFRCGSFLTLKKLYYFYIN